MPTLPCNYSLDILLVANAAGIHSYLHRRPCYPYRTHPMLCNTHLDTWMQPWRAPADLAPRKLFRSAVKHPPPTPKPHQHSWTWPLLTALIDVRFTNRCLVFTNGSKADSGGLGSGWCKAATGESQSIQPTEHDLQLSPSLLPSFMHHVTSLTLLIDSLTAI
mgnify:CR=1 FL=1